MKYFQSLLLILFSFFVYFYLFTIGNVYSSFSQYENQVFESSSKVKVKKVQRVFKGLDLYNGPIDGKFESIKKQLLDYQKKAGIIKNDNDYGAAYFGNKTIEALEKDYSDKFLDLKEKYLKIDPPSINDRYFYVTAYYSPLPGQSRYTTGSYAGDIRLNGGGKITASGKKVFTGLMAGPRNYAYGTKIYLEGIGVGSIEDRGGAIVNAGERGFEHDRIDVWMGYGDEGLERALAWGKRKVKGKVVEKTRNTNIQFQESKITKYKDLKVDAENPQEENVKKLQTLLKELSLYNGEINGEYSTVKNILIKYQLKNGVISSKYSKVAGYFGPKTFIAFRKGFGVGIFVEKYSEPGDYIVLSKKKKLKIKVIKNKMDTYLSKKYKGNNIKIKIYKNKVKNRLENLINQSKSITKKNELKYFKAIL